MCCRRAKKRCRCSRGDAQREKRKCEAAEFLIANIDVVVPEMAKAPSAVGLEVPAVLDRKKWGPLLLLLLDLIAR